MMLIGSPVRLCVREIVLAISLEILDVAWMVVGLLKTLDARDIVLVASLRTLDDDDIIDLKLFASLETLNARDASSEILNDGEIMLLGVLEALCDRDLVVAVSLDDADMILLPSLKTLGA